MAKVEPLPDNPTVEDLAKGITQLHSCLEDHRAHSTRSLARVNNKIKQIYTVVNEIRSNQALIARAFSIVDDEGQPTAPKIMAMMPQKEALAKVAVAAGSAVGAIYAIWRFIGFSWPFFWGWIRALNKDIIG